MQRRPQTLPAEIHLRGIDARIHGIRRNLRAETRSWGELAAVRLIWRSAQLNRRRVDRQRKRAAAHHGAKWMLRQLARA